MSEKPMPGDRPPEFPVPSDPSSFLGFVNSNIQNWGQTFRFAVITLTGTVAVVSILVFAALSVILPLLVAAFLSLRYPASAKFVIPAGGAIGTALASALFAVARHMSRRRLPGSRPPLPGEPREQQYRALGEPGENQAKRRGDTDPDPDSHRTRGRPRR